MIRLVWRTDVHLSDAGPASRTDDWTESCFEKLDQIKHVCAKINATALLDGGDLFHIKSPSRNSHRLVERTAAHHADYPCPVFVTPGNHDAVYGDYSYLPQQPLGVLYAAGVLNRLYDQHEAVFEEDGLKVRVVGIPYHGTEYEMDRFTSIERGDEDILICVAHVLASPQGGSMFEGEDIVKYTDLLDTAPDVFMFGHWHKDQGVRQIGDKTFVNIGSLTRGALSQDEVKRRPAIAVLLCGKDGVEVKVARIKVRPAEEVFDMEARVRIEARDSTMEAFVANVRKTLVDTKGDSIEDKITTAKIDERVRERALIYMEAAES